MSIFSALGTLGSPGIVITSPVSATGIVLGKFLAAYTVFVIALALTLFQVVVVQIYGTPNLAAVAGNYIAILAAAAIFVAIGVFISSLTENQFVAAIGSIGVFALLVIVDFAYVIIKVDWIQAIIYWVSIYRRFNTFFLGVFSLADFVFYLSFAAVFVFLTVRVIEKKRWS